jgi:DNA topoisomerase-1
VDDSSVALARAEGLRYVSDAMPGIRRMRRGRSFGYLDPSGAKIGDETTLGRIRSLAIPPAYTDVWICPLSNGHLQATGRDARGRKQYRYHPRWREVRDENKYARMLDFARALPAIRRRVDRDLQSTGLTREKVLASVVRLLETTAIRVGNDEYAKANGSFGLTTLRNKHARIDGADITFRFSGKSGVAHAVDLHDRRLAKILHACQELPGQRLFEYADAGGNAHPIDSNDVNEYIRDISGGDFTAKDFRTWLGTVECARILNAAQDAESQTERKSRIVEAVKQVAELLRNTPAVCRKCYVHPALLEAYAQAGTLDLPSPAKRTAGLSAGERFLVSFLRAQTKS